MTCFASSICLEASNSSYKITNQQCQKSNNNNYNHDVLLQVGFKNDYVLLIQKKMYCVVYKEQELISETFNYQAKCNTFFAKVLKF